MVTIHFIFILFFIQCFESRDSKTFNKSLCVTRVMFIMNATLRSVLLKYIKLKLTLYKLLELKGRRARSYTCLRIALKVCSCASLPVVASLMPHFLLIPDWPRYVCWTERSWNLCADSASRRGQLKNEVDNDKTEIICMK